MATYRIHDFQLADSRTGKSIRGSGGKAIVCAAGACLKSTLLNPDSNFAALTQPISLTTGRVRFAIAKTTELVDIYIFSPTGHCIVLQDVKAGDRQEVKINTGVLETAWVVPVHFTDYPATVETDTLLDLPTDALIQPDVSVQVVALDAGITFEAGILSSESGGDADGLLDAVSVAALGRKAGTIANGANTLGALFEVQDSANAGDLTHQAYRTDGTAKSLVMIPSAGADTFTGLLIIRMSLTPWTATDV